MKMKTIYIKSFMAAALAITMNACVEEQLEKGAPEREDCMGVYFVEQQKNAKDHTLEKDVDETFLEFEVRRSDISEAVEIPYEYSVYWIKREQEDGDTTYVEVPVYGNNYFKFGRLEFAKGERTTKVKVEFKGIPTGTQYRCTMNITDPQYVPVYGFGQSSISFSVRMYEWEKIEGKALYRDALFSDMFDWKGRYLETEVDVYERKDKENYFRFKNVYSAGYLARMVEGDEAYKENKTALEKEYGAYIDEDTYIYLDASDSSRVYFPDQKTGFSDGSLGDIYIASDVEEVFGGTSNLLYGTLSKDGVVTFPKNGVLFGMGGYYYFSNSSGKFRIVLPDGKAEDYGLEIKTEECVKGSGVPVRFTVAKDVAKIKYRVFKGIVSEVSMADSLKMVESSGMTIDVAEGIEDLEKTVVPAIENAPTGIYTLIACTYGTSDQTYREYASAQIGYVHADDDRRVEIFMGLHTDDMLASDKESENYSSQNSFQYWVRGKDITHAQISYYPTAYFETYQEQIKESMENYGSVGSQVLKQLNKGGLSGVLGNKLKAGTNYTFVVYAGNGYYSEFFTDTINTRGVQDLMQRSYYLSDLQKYSQPSIDEYAGEWIPVSVDIFDAESNGRAIRGNSKVKEVKLTVDGETVTAEGLFPALSTNPSIKFDFKDGLLQTRENVCGKVWVKDSTNIIPSMRFEYQYIPKTGAISSTGYFYDKFDDDDTKDRTDMMVAGFVHEDIIAFADKGTDLEFWAFAMGGFQKDRMGEETLQNIIGDAHGELILVRKGSSLLEGLSHSGSEVPEEGQVLNSLSETHKITMPEIGCIAKDLIKTDIAHELLEFNDDVRLRGIMK